MLERIHRGELTLVARDTPEPSFFAHEILNAKPYAFLDDAPLEERRAHAVQTRRTGQPASGGDLGELDPAAIEKVRAEAASGAARCRRAARRAALGGLSDGGRDRLPHTGLFDQLVSRRARDDAPVRAGIVDRYRGERIPELSDGRSARRCRPHIVRRRPERRVYGLAPTRSSRCCAAV